MTNSDSCHVTPKRRRRAKKIRKAAISCLLVISSVALTYLVLELIFPRLLHRLPLKTRGDLSDGARVLAQYSKMHTVPERYVALVGDSYAIGLGDWLLNADWNQRPEFHSAHLIHARTGKEVISFGATDYGSLGGMVGGPIGLYELINASSRFDMAPPRFIIVYFYEGNDLNDNLRDIGYRYRDRQYDERLRDPTYFRNLARERVHLGGAFARRAREHSIGDDLVLAGFVRRRAANLFGAKLRNPDKENAGAEWPPGTVNRVWVRGEEVAIPDGLQAPSLELDSDEVRLGVYVLEQSLAYLRDYFPTSKIGVVYIPSVLSSYRVASPVVSAQSYAGRGSLFKSDFVRARSDEIVALVERIARDHGVGFRDSRPHVRSKSANDLIHGPADWKHFNAKGYSALADAVIEVLEDMEKKESESASSADGG